MKKQLFLFLFFLMSWPIVGMDSAYSAPLIENLQRDETSFFSKIPADICSLIYGFQILVECESIKNEALWHYKYLIPETQTPNSIPTRTGDKICDLRKYFLQLFDFLLNSNKFSDSRGKDTEYHYTFSNACDKNFIEVFAHLLTIDSFTQNINKTSNLSMPLSAAVFYKRTNFIRSLLRLKYVDPNMPDPSDGDTPLHHATRVCKISPAILDLLLERPDVNYNSVNKKGYTPLHSAIQCDSLDAIDILLSHSETNVNARTEDQLTPLALAAKRGKESSLKMILNKPSVQIDPLDKHGHTPLLLAALNIEEKPSVSGIYTARGNKLRF